MGRFPFEERVGQNLVCGELFFSLEFSKPTKS